MKKLNKKLPVINDVKAKSEKINFIFPMFIGYNKTLEQQSDFISNSIIMMRVLTTESKVEKLRGLKKDIKQHESSDFYSFKNKFENKIKIVIQDEAINHSGYVDHNVCFNYKTDLEKNLKLSMIKSYYNIVVDDLIWKDDDELKIMTEMCDTTAEFISLSISN